MGAQTELVGQDVRLGAVITRIQAQILGLAESFLMSAAQQTPAPHFQASGNAFQSALQKRQVVPVSPGHHKGQRHTARIAQTAAFGAQLASVSGIPTCFFDPRALWSARHHTRASASQCPNGHRIPPARPQTNAQTLRPCATRQNADAPTRRCRSRWR